MLGRYLSAAVFMTAALCAFAPPAKAASLSLSVSPLVIELHGNPGDTMNMKITVRNNGLESERIVSTPMDWRTTVEGAVRMEKVGAEGSSSLAEFLRLSPGDVILGPGEARELSLTVELPANFSRQNVITWGGYFIRGLPASGTTAVFGPAATVVIYNTIGAPHTHVKLTQVHVTQTGPDSAKIVARMVNDGVGYIRPSIRAVIGGSGRVVSDDTENSPVVFAGATRVYTKNIGGLRAGTYQVDMTIDYGGATLIEGSTQFTIK